MSHELIISDLHLCEARPKTAELFFRFIDEYAKKADALYILGDFFEFWVGDDDLTPFHQSIITKLAELREHKTQLYIMHGNRDFLLGKAFCTQTNAILLADPSVIDSFGNKIILLHGDTLCTEDKAYQRYRKIAQCYVIRRIFLLLPLRLRRKIALKLRAQNPHHEIHYRPISQSHIADASRTTVRNYFAQHNVNTIIHGHTHRYGIHYYSEHKQRFVLGDWHGYGSFIQVSEAGVSLHALGAKI